MKIVLTGSDGQAELEVHANDISMVLRDVNNEYDFGLGKEDWISLRNYIDQRMGLDKDEEN